MLQKHNTRGRASYKYSEDDRFAAQRHNWREVGVAAEVVEATQRSTDSRVEMGSNPTTGLGKPRPRLAFSMWSKLLLTLWHLLLNKGRRVVQVGTTTKCGGTTYGSR